MTIEQQLAELDRAFKAITLTDVDKSVLQPEKYNTFVREAQNVSPILDLARRLPMGAPQKDIDRIGYSTRVLQKPGVASAMETKPAFATNELVAEKSRGYVALHDDSLKDNIERERLEQTLLELIGQRVGLDLEELYINGNKSTGADDFLKILNGWRAKAGNAVTGVASADFDPTDVEKMLQAMLVAMPQQYRRARAMMRYFCAFDVEDAYRDILKGRGTGLGDSAQTTAGTLAYKGIILVEVPNMPVGCSLLAPIDNIVYGIWQEVVIEPFRNPADEETQFWITVRTDCHYENEDASVFADGYTG